MFKMDIVYLMLRMLLGLEVGEVPLIRMSDIRAIPYVGICEMVVRGRLTSHDEVMMYPLDNGKYRSIPISPICYDRLIQWHDSLATVITITDDSPLIPVLEADGAGMIARAMTYQESFEMNKECEKKLGLVAKADSGSQIVLPGEKKDKILDLEAKNGDIIRSNLEFLAVLTGMEPGQIDRFFGRKPSDPYALNYTAYDSPFISKITAIELTRAILYRTHTADNQANQGSWSEHNGNHYQDQIQDPSKISSVEYALQPADEMDISVRVLNDHGYKIEIVCLLDEGEQEK